MISGYVSLFPVKIIDVLKTCSDHRCIKNMFRVFQIILTLLRLPQGKFRAIEQPTSWNSKINAYKSKRREKMVVHIWDFLIFRYLQVVVKAIGIT